ncbi:MAG: cell division protein FtsZ, partial [Proteobacteria bacterium]|nr:cell division protein FtsZ [Pseudomonadota bacterium]
RGLGAGADPDIGRDAMLEDRHAITEALAGSNMVFITAGMGGGTGTGGAAIAAQIAREMGALTVAVVTKPFSFEGKRRMKYAEEGIRRLEENVDTLITIPNQRLLEIASPELSMIDAFRMADNVLVNAVKGISDIINIPGAINVDFADVKTVMSSMGLALMGIGVAEGPGRAHEAARMAISSPLLEDVSIEGATGILINITAGEKISILEVNEACSIIQEAAHEDANIIFGAVIDENIGPHIRVTVIATGFPSRDLDHVREGNSNRPKRSPYLPKHPIAITSSLSSRQADHSRQIDSTKAFEASSLIQEERVSPDLRKTTTALSKPVLEQKPSFEEGLTRMTMEPMSSVIPSTDTSSSSFQDRETRIIGASVATVPTLMTDEIEQFDLSEDLPKISVNDTLASLSDEMDRKIDEALKIAEQLNKNASRPSEEEDLDIPSFLRKSPKDLSLS